MPVTGGKSPTVWGISFNLFKIPIIGPWLERLLNGSGKDDKKKSDGKN